MRKPAKTGVKEQRSKLAQIVVEDAKADAQLLVLEAVAVDVLRIVRAPVKTSAPLLALEGAKKGVRTAARIHVIVLVRQHAPTTVLMVVRMVARQDARQIVQRIVQMTAKEDVIPGVIQHAHEHVPILDTMTARTDASEHVQMIVHIIVMPIAEKRAQSPVLVDVMMVVAGQHVDLLVYTVLGKYYK